MVTEFEIPSNMQNAVDLFIDIAEDYEECYDILERVRGLHSFGEITDDEYDYITVNWDNLLKKYNL